MVEKFCKMCGIKIVYKTPFVYCDDCMELDNAFAKRFKIKMPDQFKSELTESWLKLRDFGWKLRKVI